MSGSANSWTDAVTVGEIEAFAKSVMPAAVFDYVASGAGDEITLRENVAAFERRRLIPRVCVEGELSMATTVLGHEVSMPIGIAPTALHGLVTTEGEAATVAGAAAANVLYCASSSSSVGVERIAQAAADGAAWWYQYYPGSGREGARRAADLGYQALVVTVDVPTQGYRDREIRAARSHPDDERYRTLWPYTQRGPTVGALAEGTRVTWSDLQTLIREVPVPVVVKGVLSPGDAIRAADLGAAAIWVSNHGGRQLDRVPATLDVLAGIAAEVADRAEIYVDGGIRRGTDVVMALGLGARAVFVGRPIVWGLSLGGAEGVAAVLEQLRDETENALRLVGALNPADVVRSMVTP